MSQPTARPRFRRKGAENSGVYGRWLPRRTNKGPQPREASPIPSPAQSEASDNEDSPDQDPVRPARDSAAPGPIEMMYECVSKSMAMLSVVEKLLESILENEKRQSQLVPFRRERQPPARPTDGDEEDDGAPVPPQYGKEGRNRAAPSRDTKDRDGDGDRDEGQIPEIPMDNGNAKAIPMDPDSDDDGELLRVKEKVRLVQAEFAEYIARSADYWNWLGRRVAPVEGLAGIDYFMFEFLNMCVRKSDMAPEFRTFIMDTIRPHFVSHVKQCKYELERPQSRDRNKVPGNSQSLAEKLRALQAEINMFLAQNYRSWRWLAMDELDNFAVREIQIIMCRIYTMVSSRVALSSTDRALFYDNWMKEMAAFYKECVD